MHRRVLIPVFLLALALVAALRTASATIGSDAPPASTAGTGGDRVRAEADAVVGVWLVASRKAKVRIVRRGDVYVGALAWIAHPVDAAGNPKLDRSNPDPRLRTRPMVGLEMLRNFTYRRDLVWEGGEIYDPQKGKTYNCRLMLSPDHRTLTVRGYVGISLLGRSQEWSRVDE